MKKFIALIGITGLSLAPACQAHESDDPVLTKLMLDQLEWRGDTSRSESQTAVEGETWIGKDLSKFWLKFDAQYQQSEFGDRKIVTDLLLEKMRLEEAAVTASPRQSGTQGVIHALLGPADSR